MNIVKGVADLIRRTSGGQTGESTSGPQVEKFSAPSPKIRFSEVGDEAILCALWGRYENAIDKVEKRKLLFVFLKQFLIVYKNWEPVDSGQFLDTASSAAPTGEYSSRFDDIVVGCSAGHPAEIILVLTEEVGQLTALVTELSGASTSFIITSEGFPVLDALKIVTRSMHNCRVFGYYGGIQKLTTLMKAAVVQLKTVASILSADESLSNFTVEKTGILQKVLVYVVSIICSFIDLHTNTLEKTQLYSNAVEFSVPRSGASSSDPPSSSKVSICETRLQWHQKAVVSVMEAGGLNWLVELLRVIRRLSMKEQWTDRPLQYLTLRTLYSALSENPRGQNHFRSIGGLEVLLDGLGLPPNNPLISKISCCSDEERDENPSLDVFRLHILSLEVLREAVFGNLNNLQFLCENGRVHKFANSFCLLAFMVQEYKQQSKDDFQLPAFDSINENKVEICIRKSFLPLPDNASYLQYWSDYAVKLNRVLCSFLLAAEENRSHLVLLSTGRSAMPVSSVYGELSIKWIMRVLLTIFPCIKAFSNQNELPIHLRIFVNTLQNSVLHAFRMILVSSPLLLEVFREEGIWDLIFSENFFYFGPVSEGSSIECCTYNEGSLSNSEIYASNYTDCQGKAAGVEILQMEVISFVEFAATFSGSAHNLPECSVLLDALEQSACNPEIASILAKSLLRILQLSCEKTIASFKTLDAITRVLKVACIQAQEYGRPGNIGLNVKNNSVEVVSPQSCQRFDPSEKAQSCLKSMEASMDLLMEYISIADSDDAEILVLRSSTCVDCLFDLFWEKTFRNRVLNLILDLMKIVPFSDEDQRAKLRLCSKYLETFTQIKEREKSFAELSIDLLVGMRDMLLTDQVHYQDLFRDGECFLHVVSLLNGNLDEANGEKLVLNVLQTLTCLLARNDASKAAFRALVGKGYQTLQSLLLEFCQWRPSEGLLNALLDMLVDGKFDIKASPVIKNEDVIILYLSILQKSSDSSRHYGLNVFQQLLRDSISNRASCVRAGMLNFLLDWFSQEDMDSVILKIAQLIQVTGGHSISGKDIRKIFALLRSKKIGTQQKYCSLLLTSILSMLNEKGPTAFFDLNGSDSGVKITTPVQWPLNKGFSFSCWLRVESFPRNGTMGLFSFLTENGRGCLAALAKDKLIYEAIIHSGQISLAISQSDHLSFRSSVPVLRAKGENAFRSVESSSEKHSPPAIFPANFSGDGFFSHRKERLEEIYNFSQNTGARKPSTRRPRAFFRPATASHAPAREGA